MSDQLDPIAAPPQAATQTDARRHATSASRLVARLFVAAGHPLRVRLLHCLMRPLGTLGAAGVAAGAFVAFLGRDGRPQPQFDADAVSLVTSQQVHELASFVEQVDPQALLQFANLASGSSLALATSFSAAALVLLTRRLQPASRSAHAG